jgi:hypothetical protein
MSKDILGAVVKMVVELPEKMLGVLYDLLEKMLGKEGWLWLDELKKFLRKEPTWVGIVVAKILRLISGGESLTIDGSDGKLVNDGTITWYFDDGCEEEGANESCPSTEDVAVEVYEMAEDATFTKMFGSLSSDLQEVYFSSRDQIRIFALKHRKWLRDDGFGTFFPYKSKKRNFFVAFVRVDGGGLRACVRRLGCGFLWYAECRHRLVVPVQL